MCSVKKGTNMKRLTVVATICCALTAPVVAQDAEPHGMPAVDAALKPLVESGQLPGLAVVVLKDGKRVHELVAGKRNLASGAPVELNTLFHIYSMTKPVTAVAMMVLYEQGKWKPEDPISKILPEFKNVKVFKGLDAAGKPILEQPKTPPTIAQLMTHTAGFTRGTPLSSYVDQLYKGILSGATSPKDWTKRLASLPLAYEPGTQWRYSVSMDVEGRIIERVSSMSLPDFMRKYIFQPLKMNDTGFYVPPEKAERLSKIYYGTKAGLVEVPSILGSALKPPVIPSGGGGLVSTAGDYARFAQMLLNDGELEGVRVLKPGSVQAIMTSHIAPEIVNGGFGVGLQWIRPGYEYGYSGVVVTDPALAKVNLGKGSYLWDGAAGSWFWVDPENRIVFVGMIQRYIAPGFPPVEQISQKAVMESMKTD